MHGLPKLLVIYWLELSTVVRVRVRARNREWISDCFFFPCLKLTNTFVSPTWLVLLLLKGCASKSVGVVQETRDHSYFRTQSVVNKAPLC